MKKQQIVLVAMPFGPLVTPSFALSLIKPLLEAEGMTASLIYPIVQFSDAIGDRLYHYIASGIPRAHDLLGEFIFSRALFGQASASPVVYLDYIRTAFSERARQSAEPETSYVLDAIEHRLDELLTRAELFIQETALNILELQPKVIGLSSVYQQNTASLALAKTLKKTNPNIKIILGGANCEGPMGLAIFEAFDFVDAVVSGEGEPVAVPVFRHFLEGTPLERTEGVHIRTENSVRRSMSLGTKMVSNMDEVPVPDYADYIEAIKGRSLPEKPRLLFETSRGCWWGEKHHCTFCGLNGNTMKFRSKSPEIALKQLLDLIGKHPGYSICMTDNIIDNKYFKNFVPKLADMDVKIELFYEMKANLKKEQIALLAKAGIKRIQPGIESLSTDILKLMGKGTTALQNIQVLKWCRQYQVDPEWNFLWGFPNESPLAYENMAKIIPAITHLKPPSGVGRIRLDRFSPNFRNAETLFSGVRPFPAYSIVYPLGNEVITSMAYFFDYEHSPSEQNYTNDIHNSLRTWQSQFNGSFLFYIRFEDYVLVFDRRDETQTPATHILVGHAAKIFLSGEQVCSTEIIYSGFPKLEGDILENTLQELVDKGIVLRDGDHFLSLAVEASANYPGAQFLQSLASVFSVNSEAI